MTCFQQQSSPVNLNMPPKEMMRDTPQLKQLMACRARESEGNAGASNITRVNGSIVHGAACWSQSGWHVRAPSHAAHSPGQQL